MVDPEEKKRELTEEEKREKLKDILKQALVLMGDIEKMEKCVAILRKEVTGIYLEADKKLNGG